MLVTENSVQELRAGLARLLGRNVTSVHKLGGGGNSRVYRVTCGTGAEYVAKFYPDDGPRGRDRLEAEFRSLTFLRQNGVECVPSPVEADRQAKCAIYSYIEGRKIFPSEVTELDIEKAVRFLAVLKELSNHEGSASLPNASDACYSIQDAINGVNGRLNRLQGIREEGNQYHDLESFLKEEFSPRFELVLDSCRSTLQEWDIPVDSELGTKERTLSPSDFGFHNALRRPDGDITFLDFEYFGWDDPAKMISDFLLHPGMDLSHDSKQRFLELSLSIFADDPAVKKRMELIYPLCGLKWCLLLLNEFVPEFLSRRGFAKGGPIQQRELQLAQLAKAKIMLEMVQNGHEPPY